jgi:hypothetical protein
MVMEVTGGSDGGGFQRVLRSESGPKENLAFSQRSGLSSPTRLNCLWAVGSSQFDWGCAAA